jgi:hypothetical protein
MGLNIAGAVHTYKTNLANSANGEASAVIDTGNGQLAQVTVYNADAATAYLMIFDKATAPALNDVPAFPPIQVPANNTANFTAYHGSNYGAGLAVGLSSTNLAYTAVANTKKGVFRVDYYNAH